MTCLRPVVTVLLVTVLLSFSAYGRNRQAARESYKKARAYHDRLIQNSLNTRSLNEYSRALFLYRTVIDQDPTYGACDDSLYSIASLYEEMAERFENDTYRARAIRYYEFLAKEYPLTKHKQLALSQAAQLKRTASELDQSAPPEPKTEAATSNPDWATVSEIRYWSNEDYTRVVIQLDQEVEFEKHILSSPNRIYFDLHRAQLKPHLQGKTYDINDLFIKGVRVASNRPGVVRVVLDFEKINKHTIFALYDPFRIVTDTQGDRSAPTPSGTNEVTNAVEAVIALDRETPDENVVASPPVVPVPNLDGTRSLTRVLGLKVGRIVIDPGHGGRDSGTIGRNGLKEKDLVLAVSHQLKGLLEERLGTEVVLTRENDRFIPLEERTAIANHLSADLFLSIHANSSRDRKVSGVETFFQGFTTNHDEREVASRENASSQKNIRELEDLLKRIALGDYNEESRDFAQVIQDTFYSKIRPYRPLFRDRGIKKAPFIVLINLNMPGILLEIGFISNPSEEGYLKKQQGQEAAAEAIYTGVEKYFRALGTVPLKQRRAALQP